MPTILISFLLIVAISSLLRLILSLRQSRTLLAHRQSVPSTFAEQISLEQHQTATEYALAKQRFARWQLLFDTFLLLAFTISGGINLLNTLAKASSTSPLTQNVLLIVYFILINAILALPWQWYQTFRLEARFGFNRTSYATFFADHIKAALLGAIIGIPLLYLLIYLMGVFGQHSYLAIWLTWVGFSLALVWAFPKWIAPIFNQFKPLNQPSLEAKIQALLKRANFQTEGIYIMDGSKRSGHANAYFTGMGKHKRIVFFDTLLKQTTEDEAEAILAHELGHYHHRHIHQQIITTFFIGFITLFILNQLMYQPIFYHSLGVAEPSHAAALLLFALIIPIVSYPLSPLIYGLSRRNEYEADAYAAKQSQAQALIDALTKLYQQNAAATVADPWYSRFHHTHPSPQERIAKLNKLISH